MFSVLTEGYQDSVNFSRLPIPFACVSENLVDGSEVVFHRGVLATAMRSSMSIPGVFAPVNLNGRVLVDGGMVNNYPVDVALQMGADIIIGVDVQSPLLDAGQLKSGKSLICRERKNIKRIFARPIYILKWMYRAILRQVSPKKRLIP